MLPILHLSNSRRVIGSFEQSSQSKSKWRARSSQTSGLQIEIEVSINRFQAKLIAKVDRQRWFEYHSLPTSVDVNSRIHSSWLIWFFKGGFSVEASKMGWERERRFNAANHRTHTKWTSLMSFDGHQLCSNLFFLPFFGGAYRWALSSVSSVVKGRLLHFLILWGLQIFQWLNHETFANTSDLFRCLNGTKVFQQTIDVLWAATFSVLTPSLKSTLHLSPYRVKLHLQKRSKSDFTL